MKNKTIFKRLLSSVLMFVMIITSSLPIYANTNESTEANPEVIFEMDNSRIDYYETDNGDRVFLEYVDGVLTQKNMIPHTENNIVIRKVYSYNNGSVLRSTNSPTITKDTINVEDYIKINEGKNTLRASSSTSLGTINYRALIDTGFINYGVKCNYTSSDDTTTYTIKSYVGKVIDIVSVIAAAINLPAAFISTFIKRVCVSAGILITGNAFKNALSTTVACKRTSYKWTLTNTTQSSHKVTQYGYKYYVTDSKYHTGETYYENLVPTDWKKQSFAVNVHESMFSYPAWEVVSWK